jgi:addiction module HigA family antidote
MITERYDMNPEERLPNIHPGEVLREEFLTPLGLSQYALAKAIGVPAPRISQIRAGQRAITADTALRLARFFNTSEGFWLGLQADFALEAARLKLGERLDAIAPLDRAA